MTLSASRRPRRPDWPRWVYDTYNERGLVHLEATYRQLKDASDLERAGRISADDVASSITAQLRVEGRTDLFRGAGRNGVREGA